MSSSAPSRSVWERTSFRVKALKYGEQVTDKDTGYGLGWRMSIPLFSVADTLKKYEVRTRRDEKTQEYIVGVMERRVDA